MNESLIGRLSKEHPISASTVRQWLALAPNYVVMEACKLIDVGFREDQIKQAILGTRGNATAQEMAIWIATRLQGVRPGRLSQLPWYARLA